MAKTTNTKRAAKTTKAKAAPRRRKAQQGQATRQQMAITGVFGAACAGLGALAYKVLSV